MGKNYFKQFFAMLLAFAVAASMGVATTSYAAETDKDDILTVNDVEAGATVTAYQIVKEEDGKWTNISGKNMTFTDKDGVIHKGDDAVKNTYPNPTAGEIAAIAKNPPAESFTLTESTDKNGKPIYTATGKDAGMYLILVSGTGATIYNPMIVSIDYDGAIDSVSAASNFTKDAYAKKTTPEITKSNTQAGNTAGGTTYNGTSAQVGDTVGFKIETTLPSYSKQYTNPVFEVSDELSDGLELVKGFPDDGTLTVKVGGKEVAAKDGDVTNYTIDGYGKKDGFTIAFSKAYLESVADKSEDDRAVEITYNAKVTEAATCGFIPNTNEAKISFSNNPNEESDRGKDEDDSKIYTFGIDANLNGTETTNNIKTHEVIKLDENGKEITLSHTEDGEETSVTSALKGATFTLYSDEKCTTKVTSSTTSDNGYMQMTGLKEGTYYLKETAAPTGYTVDPTVHTVEISAVYNKDGTLASYTVKIDGKASTYAATYTNNKPTITTTETSTTFIKNTKMPALPSTGGIGTYIFVIIGTVMMLFAGIALARKSKKSREI